MAFLREPRTGTTRRPIHRIYVIHEAVKEGRFPNCSTLAERLEVTNKPIQRDITFMRDERGLPLEYDEKLHGYSYSQDVSQFPVFQLGATELAGLFLARQALESVKGTALEQTMREVFAKLTKMIGGQVQFSWAVGEVEGCWYLIGRDPDREAMRTFALPRISRLKASARRFDRPADFDGTSYLHHLFGVWTAPDDEALHLVREELRDYAARMAPTIR